MKKPNIGVFIGRIQPLHNGHLAAIKMALEKEDQLIVVLGSACEAKTVKNPWTTEEREGMVRSCLSDTENERVSVVACKDYLYNDTQWLAGIQAVLSAVEIKTENIAKLFKIEPWRNSGVSDSVTVDIDECNVTVYGHNKDKSTLYLNMFPQWNFVDTGDKADVDAEQARDFFFHNDTLDLKRVCPEPVFLKLKEEVDKNTPEYQRLYNEFRHVMEYKAMWSSAPFPPIFVTADAVVIKSGHILVGRRRGQLGNGLLALPGGFLRDDEPIVDGCIRELKEETRIGLPKDELKKRIRESQVFDHPDRSLRGRTITHAYCIDLGSGTLPKIKGDDDMEKARWMPLSDVDKYEEEFFEDHWHIIKYFWEGQWWRWLRCKALGRTS